MSKKPPKESRRKSKDATTPTVASDLTPGEIVRRRRNRRMLFLGIIALTLPILEVMAYQFRSILMVVVNRSDEVITDVKVTYPGGSFEAKELKPGGEMTHVARPNYTFTSGEFSTYRVAVSASTSRGNFRLLEPRTGTIDYSARETFSIQPQGTEGPIAIKHTTRPGFPLGTIRDLLTKLGVG